MILLIFSFGWWGHMTEQSRPAMSLRSWTQCCERWGEGTAKVPGTYTDGISGLLSWSNMAACKQNPFLATPFAGCGIFSSSFTFSFILAALHKASFSAVQDNKLCWMMSNHDENLKIQHTFKFLDFGSLTNFMKILQILGGCGHFTWEVNYLTRVVYLPGQLPPPINSHFILWAEALIEDFDFLADFEALWATVALAMFALLETARDIGDNWAAREFLDMEVVIFTMKVCWWVRQDTIHTFYTSQ